MDADYLSLVPHPERLARLRRSRQAYASLRPGAKSARGFESRLRNYRLTAKQFAELVLVQDGKCAICDTAFDEPKRMHIDHDHVSGRVRGLLCRNCNTGLGRFTDSPEILEAAARYLRDRMGVSL